MIRDRLFFIFISPRDAILFLSGVQGNHAFLRIYPPERYSESNSRLALKIINPVNKIIPMEGTALSMTLIPSSLNQKENNSASKTTAANRYLGVNSHSLLCCVFGCNSNIINTCVLWGRTHF